MNAIDTNVWIYCHDTREREKQAAALELIAEVGSIVLLWQVGCEFIASARKLEPFGFKSHDAWEALRDMEAMADKVVVPRPELWWSCRVLQQNHSFHYWDALLIACCLDAGVAGL
jgi:predicted nucleic acid-binding protein